MFIVAKNVLEKRELRLDDNLLKVKPVVTLPPDKKKLFVENIDYTITRSTLSHYVEQITQQNVVNVELGDDSNVAMVTLVDDQGNYPEFLFFLVLFG